jgi:hypothetical protein
MSQNGSAPLWPVNAAERIVTVQDGLNLAGAFCLANSLPAQAAWNSDLLNRPTLFVSAARRASTPSHAPAANRLRFRSGGGNAGPTYRANNDDGSGGTTCSAPVQHWNSRTTAGKSQQLKEMRLVKCRGLRRSGMLRRDAGTMDGSGAGVGRGARSRWPPAARGGAEAKGQFRLSSRRARSRATKDATAQDLCGLDQGLCRLDRPWSLPSRARQGPRILPR